MKSSEENQYCLPGDIAVFLLNARIPNIELSELEIILV